MKKSKFLTIKLLGLLSVLLLSAFWAMGFKKPSEAFKGLEIALKSDHEDIGKLPEGSILELSVNTTQDPKQLKSSRPLVSALESQGAGQPWKAIPDWQRLTPRERVARLLDGPFAVMDGQGVIQVEAAKDELHLAHPGGMRASSQRFEAVATGADLMAKAEALQKGTGREAMFVFYPAGVVRTAVNRRVLTGRVKIETAPEAVATVMALVNQSGVAKAEQVQGAAGFVLASRSDVPGGALVGLAEITERVGDLGRVEVLFGTELHKAAVPTDPLYSQQWYLRNLGTILPSVAGIDVNVVNVWDTRKGSGVVIGMVDDGFEISHPDLASGYVGALSRDYVGGDFDPSPYNAAGDPWVLPRDDNHGTAVAGLAVARENNGLGISGVAPRASWAGIRLLEMPLDEGHLASAMDWQNQSIAIKVNSWGPPPNLPNVLAEPGSLPRLSIRTGTETGRGGKGVIYVFPAGNGRQNGMQGNKNAYANMIHVTAVSAVNASGVLAPYSEFGSHVVATAPSGGASGAPKVLATDRTGAVGYNAGGSPGDLADGNYTVMGLEGTSVAAPLVSGVVALMLEAQPNLNWRDVKEILLRTGRKLNPGDSKWTSREGGRSGVPLIKHHEQYGGGLVDAEAAVALAQSWTSLGTMSTRSQTWTGSQAVADNSTTGVTLPLTFSASPVMRVEHVEVVVSLAHDRRGDLEIQLVSPTGVVSSLATLEPLDDGAVAWPSGAAVPLGSRGYAAWPFTSVRHWGEGSTGTWNVVVKDLAAGTTGTIQSVELRLHGMEVTPVSVTSAPVNQIVREGQPFSFSVTAGGTPGFTYQWRKDGVDIVGATSSTYTDSSALLAEAGTYSVVIGNSYSTATAEAKLVVYQAPSSPVVAALGSSISIPVTAAGPGISYQWKLNGMDLVPSAKYSGVYGPSLTVNNLAPGDDSNVAGLYELSLILPGVPPVSTGPVSLTVAQPPSFVGAAPGGRIVLAGSVVNFVVVANGYEPISYEWSRNNTVIGSATGSSYSLPNTLLADAGTYAVRLTNLAGQVTATMPLAVVQPATPNVTTYVGGTLNLTTTAVGVGLSYQWRRNGLPLSNGGRVSGSNTANLVISNVQTSDDSLEAGVYDCLVTLPSVGSLSAGAISVEVLRAPYIDPASMPNRVIYAGNNTTFSPTVISELATTYGWTFNSGAILGASAVSYTRSNASLADAGTYSITATNAAGPSTASAVLGVVQRAPVTVEVNEGATLTLTASGAGPGLSYQWRLNGVPLTNGGRVSGAGTSQLVISNIVMSDRTDVAGYYECIVTVAGVSLSAGQSTLIVRERPTISGALESLVRFEGEPFQFLVNSGGATPITHQWRKNDLLVSGATNPLYSKASAALPDGGTWTVVLTNSAGTNSTSAGLAVIRPLPPTLTVNAGSTLSLPLTVVAPPGTTYQWLRNGVPLADGGRVSGSTTTTLAITNFGPADDSSVVGPYECVVTVLGAAPRSAGQTQVSVLNPPTLKVPMANQITMTGQSFLFQPELEDATGVTYVWKKASTTITAATASTYGKTNAALTDAATYTVVLTNAAGNTPASAYLAVVQPLPPTATGLLGGTFSLTANAAGPELSYLWKLDGVPLSNGGRISGATSPTLRITGLTALDDSDVAGLYECEVTVGGSATLSAGTTDLSVNQPPKIELASDLDDLVVSGPAEILMHPDNGADRYTITGLPSGLRYDPVTGRIYGTPNVAVTDHPVTIVASNAYGVTRRVIRITIHPIHPDLLGSYWGLVDRHPHARANGDLGGEVTNLVLTSSGFFTGRISLAGVVHSIGGRILNSLTVDPVATVVLRRAGKPNVSFDFTLRVSDTSLTGSLTEDAAWSTGVLAYRNAYTVKSPNPGIVGRHNYWMEVPRLVDPALAPLGAFCGRVDLRAPGTGIVSLALSTPPWTHRIKTVVVTTGHRIPLHQMQPGNKESVQGWLELTELPAPTLNLITGTTSWFKKGPRSSADRLYREGFDLGVYNANLLNVQGSEYKPEKSYLMGDFMFPTTAEFLIRVEGGQLEEEGKQALMNAVFNVSTSRLRRAWKHRDLWVNFPQGNQAKYNFFLCDFFGNFFGSAEVVDGNVRRVVNLYCYYAPGLRRGGGSYTICELPVPPYTAKTAPMRMGYLEIEALY
jgi:subtilisin family serine protease